MRTKLVFALLAATLSGAAFAAPEANSVERAAAASAPTCTGATYRMTAADIEGALGEFALADGRRLSVTAAHGKLYARVGGTKTEIVALAPNRFISRDDKLYLELDEVPFANKVRLVVGAGA